MQEKQNNILVADGVRTKLKDIFKTSYPTVRAALRGNSNSELSRKIRFTALTRFEGVEQKIKKNEN